MTTGRHEDEENLPGAGPAGGRSDATPDLPPRAEEWLPGVYDELRRLATARLHALPPGQTLQPTAVVHEAFVRLVERERRTSAGWENRAHFFFAAARAIQDVLVEHARAKGRLKRGGDRRRLDPDALVNAAEAPADELLALSDALQHLEHAEPEMHRMVMLRFYAGLSAEDSAELLGMPLRTFERRWRFAKSWLRRELAEADRPSDSEQRE